MMVDNRKNMLSVVLATRNEEDNIEKCLRSVKDLADEIIVVDEESTDRTKEIVEEYNAKVFTVKHEEIFHKTKQKALELANYNWILQLDADERVTTELSEEIKSVIELSSDQIKKRKIDNRKKWQLFRKHQRLIEQREGSLGKNTGEVVAFFIPRVNYFLGKPLEHAGLYPDGVIRLVKKGKAYFPVKSVHELIKIDGDVAWLFNDLKHYDSPTLKRYLERMNRYTDLQANELKIKYKSKTSYIYLLYYSFIKPFIVFLNLYIRHKGVLDGLQGFIWSLFSSIHFPIAYFKYWQKQKA